MECYALYRLPYAGKYIRISSQQSIQVAEYSSIGTQNGFVIAPFACSETQNIVIIPADEISAEDVPAGICKSMPTGTCTSMPEEQYRDAFRKFHEAVSEGRFGKLVLARRKRIASEIKEPNAHKEAEELFFCACRAFPRLMIMLFSTPQTGTWIIASPEILIEGQDCRYHTVALAGTMEYSEGYAEWSEKNRREQHVVEQYIEKALDEMAADVVKNGPTTMRAGSLVHLRTDYHFTLDSRSTDGSDIAGNRKNAFGMILGRLHPTPAVCGMPKDEAQEFILRNEGIDRRYYSGFAGPLNIYGATHLYVSLRCAEIDADGFWLYAGGGIMPDSLCENEWKETEEKMKTIAHVLR